MSSKLKRLFIIVIVIQIVFLLGLVGYRETILALGRTAVLRTVPVDPRDLFKGEYVTLRYEISTLDGTEVNQGSKRYRLLGEISEGDTVYVALSNIDGDDFSLDVQTGEPSDRTDLFIKGQVDTRKNDVLTVEYGIEQYFVSEGRGLEIEQADDVNVRIKITRSGIAAIEAFIIDGEDWTSQNTVSVTAENVK
jgi:uncharacterized membrane-anchored protein